MRYRAVAVRVAFALLILVVSKSAYAGSCSTPDVSTGKPFGGRCDLSCDGTPTPGAGVSGYRASVVLMCGDGTSLRASGVICADDCVALSSSPKPIGLQCSCTSEAPGRFLDPNHLPPIGNSPDLGLVLGASCEC